MIEAKDSHRQTEEELKKAVALVCAQIESDYEATKLTFEKARQELQKRTDESLQLAVAQVTDPHRGTRFAIHGQRELLLIGRDVDGAGARRRQRHTFQLATGIEPQRHASAVYPGTCRPGLGGRIARAWRLNVERVLQDLNLGPELVWHDRRLGPQSQRLMQEVGDFVLRRADGLWAYQLAVVVDDAAQGVTDVVRGMDLLDNTARQILLQRALGLPTPRYLHVPLVLADNGEKLSKQNGAQALDLSDPARCLEEARRFLVASGFQAR